MDRVLVTKMMVGAIHMQVCAVADASDEEILVVCNSENPSGTSLGWAHVCRGHDEFFGDVKPVTCADDPTRLHFIVGC